MLLNPFDQMWTPFRRERHVDLPPAAPQADPPVDLSVDAALRRVLGRGITIRTFFDLGAANGVWAQSRADLVPGARFHLIEAMDDRRPALEAVCRADPRFSFTSAAVGDHEGESYFFTPNDNPYGGWTAKESVRAGMQPIRCVTLDGEMKRLALEGPFALKFDIHTSELEVLDGATEVLSQTELIVFEMLFWEDGGRRVPRYMNRLLDLGFWLVDIADPSFRPSDGCFWQVDMLFVRADRPEAKALGYR